MQHIYQSRDLSRAAGRSNVIASQSRCLFTDVCLTLITYHHDVKRGKLAFWLFRNLCYVRFNSTYTAKLICVFVFTYAKTRFSHDAAHFSFLCFFRTILWFRLCQLFSLIAAYLYIVFVSKQNYRFCLLFLLMFEQ